MNSSVRIFIAEYVLVSLISSQVLMPLSGYAEDLVIVDDTIVSYDIAPDNTADHTPNEDIPLPETQDVSIETVKVDEITSSIIENTGSISETTDTGSIDNVTDTGSSLEPTISTGTISTGEEGELAVTPVPPVAEVIYTPVPREEVPTDTPIVETNQILIQFHDNLIDLEKKNSEFEVNDIETTAGITMTEVIAENNIAVMELSEIQNPLESIIPSIEFVAEVERDAKIDETIAELKTDPRIAHVQRNFKYELTGLGQNKDITSYTTAYSGRNIPNEGSFSNMWGLDNQGQTIGVNNTYGTVDADIDYPEAMSYASGRLSSTGGVIVAVLDTGIDYTHTDLQGHLWDGTNCLSDTGAYIGGCMYGYDMIDDDKEPFDLSILDSGAGGHGTHVSGTIGAVANNNTGSVGVAPNVEIMNVRICDFSCMTTDIIRGINFAQHNGAQVINMSLGGPAYFSNQENFILGFDLLTYQTMRDFPGIITAAAGNDSTNTDESRYIPAGFGSDITVSGEGGVVSGEVIGSGVVTIPGLKNVIAVAASDQNDFLAGFSNYGSGTVHIAAPGTNIYSTFIDTTGSIIGTNVLSGEWTIDPSATGANWSTTSGEWIFADMRQPYASGEMTYVERTFTNTGSETFYSIGSFPVWCNTPMDAGNFKDYLSIEYSTGNTYSTLKNIDEYTLRYSQFNFFDTDLSIDGFNGRKSYIHTPAFLVSSGIFKIRISWHTDSIDDGSYGGCALSNTEEFYISKINTENKSHYRFWEGTSMATPHVAGAAALAWNFKPDATTQEIRDAIIYSGDSKVQLAGKVMFGSRLNVLNMLQALETPRVIHQTAIVSGESGIKLRVETNLSTDDFGYPTVLVSNNTGFLNDMGTNFTWSIIGTSVDDKNVFYEYDSLDSDTTYYYKFIYCGLIYCDEVSQNTYYIFHTPSVVSQTLTGTVVKNEDIAIDNATATGVVFSGGTASGKIILSNTGTNTSVEIPTYGLIISASGTWDGVIESPKTWTGNNTIITTSGTLNATRIEQIGSDIASLALSGQVATIHIPFIAIDGTQVPVYRANTISDTYSYIATCIISSSICTFTTNHFSAFALGQGVNPIIPGSTSAIGPGGGVFINIGQVLLDNMMNKPLGAQGITSSSRNILIGDIKGLILNYRNRSVTLQIFTDQSKALTADELGGKISDTLNDSLSIYGTLIKYDIMINFIKYKIRTSPLETKYYTTILLRLQEERSLILEIF